MKLMGDANWWFPSWLSWLPRLDIEGEAGLPPREYDEAHAVKANGADSMPEDPDAELAGV